MRILVLGGTSFVGRAIVERSSLADGDEVTLFGRGRTGTELFPGVARRLGDRDTGDYAALAAGSWDAVVDVSGYVPRHVRQAAEVLGDRIGRYLFVSSAAVYQPPTEPGSDEDAPRLPPEHSTEEINAGTYGPLKVACEDDLRGSYGSRLTVVRPGVVAGPHDSQNGFTYWVRRAAHGGQVAVPGSLDQPVQVLDSRDLAGFVVRLLRDDRPGAFDAVGPAEPVTIAGLIETCARVAGSAVELVEVPAQPRFPLIRHAASFQRSAARARAAGLPATPLAATAADVLAWDRAHGEPPLTVGFSPEEERALLAAANA